MAVTTSKTSTQSRSTSATGPGGMFGGNTSGGSRPGGAPARPGGAPARPGGSGVKGSKGGGASIQKPGAGTKANAGAQAGKVTKATLGQAKTALSGQRNTAIGKVATAAKQNAQNARPSGTSTQFGGKNLGPGQIYSNAGRSSSALNSVLNNTRLAGMNNRQTIDAVARNMGLSNPVGRAGMIGTFDHESAGLNPRALGDQGTAFGLGQWRGDRRAALGNYARGMGQDVANPGLQTAFGVTEMGRAYPKTLKGLQNASNVPAAVAAMNDYERPRGWTPGGNPANVAGWGDRVARSNTALAQFGAPPAPTRVASNAPLGSATAVEEAVRRNFVNQNLGPLANDPAINRNLTNALGQSMWATRIADAPRSVPLGNYGEVSPASPLAGFRTLAEQKGIPGKFTGIKNPARGYHTWGMAVDVAPDRLPGETQRAYDNRVGEVNRTIAGNITDPAVKWGGEFRRVDPAHFQYGSGSVARSLDKYGGPIQTAGVRPAAAPAQPAPTRVASAALGSIPRPQARPADLRPPVPRPQARPSDLRDPRRMAAGTYTQPYDVAPPIPNMRPDSFPRGFGDMGIGRAVNAYTPPSFGDEGVGRTVNPYSAPVPVPTARPDSFPRGFGDVGVPRTVNPYSAPISPFSDAGIRKPTTPFVGMPAASIVPPIPKARPPMQGPPKPMGGMSFTPGLPGPQKQYYDRVAQTPGPQQQYALPAYPGAQPAGTYTAPYDVAQAAPRPTQPAGTYTAPYDAAPRMSPLGNAGQEYHQHEAPPNPSQYRNEAPPAAPHPGTPGSQTATIDDGGKTFWQQGTDLYNQATTAADPYVKQAKEGSEELKKAVETYGEDAVLNYIQQQAGVVPQSLRDVGPGSKQYTRRVGGGGYGGSGGGGGGSGGGNDTANPAIYLAGLRETMASQGASAEDLAYVDQLISELSRSA